MKKLLILAWAIMPFLFLSKANAQLSFTPHFGVNFSKMSWKNTKSDTILDYLNSSVFGLTSKYNFNKKWAAELGIQYSGKGFRGKSSKNAFKIQYIDFMPAVEFAPNSFLSFYSGLNIGLYTGTYARIENDKWFRVASFIDEIYGKVNVGGLVGLRFKVEDIITIGIHYNHGIIPIGKLQQVDENGVVNRLVNEYQQNFQITLGYQINVKKK